MTLFTRGHVLKPAALSCWLSVLPLFAAPAFAERSAPGLPDDGADAEPRNETSSVPAKVRITGVSAARDEYGVFAPLDGRVEEMKAGLFDAVAPEDVLARMVPVEMAALLDAAWDSAQVEKRWEGTYDYHPVKPGARGIVTDIHVSSRALVRKGDRLFTVAKKIVVLARNEDALRAPLARGMRAELTGEKDGTPGFTAALVNFVPLKGEPGFARLWLEADGPPEGIRTGEKFGGFLYPAR